MCMLCVWRDLYKKKSRKYSTYMPKNRNQMKPPSEKKTMIQSRLSSPASPPPRNKKKDPDPQAGVSGSHSSTCNHRSVKPQASGVDVCVVSVSELCRHRGFHVLAALPHIVQDSPMAPEAANHTFSRAFDPVSNQQPRHFKIPPLLRLVQDRVAVYVLQ